MAKIEGGITSRPSGRLGNIIFGAARTQAGKVVTAREAVDPSNPNTPAQQSQRTKFSESLDIVQAIGPSVYQEDWNRARGQLPGFQSWMSVLLENINDQEEVSPPSDVPLGDLPFPATWSVSSGAGVGEIDLTWDTSTPAGADAADQAVAVAIPVNPGDRPSAGAAFTDLSAERQDGSVSFVAGSTGTDVVVGLYFRADDPDVSPLTLAAFRQGTTG